MIYCSIPHYQTIVVIYKNLIILKVNFVNRVQRSIHFHLKIVLTNGNIVFECIKKSKSSKIYTLSAE